MLLLLHLLQFPKSLLKPLLIAIPLEIIWGHGIGRHTWAMVFRPGLLTDLAYMLINGFIHFLIIPIFLVHKESVYASSYIHSIHNTLDPIGPLPRALLALFIFDFLKYIYHRFLLHGPWFNSVHAVHHSAQSVDFGFAFHSTCGKAGISEFVVFGDVDEQTEARARAVAA